MELGMSMTGEGMVSSRLKQTLQQKAWILLYAATAACSHIIPPSKLRGRNLHVPIDCSCKSFTCKLWMDSSVLVLGRAPVIPS